MEQRARTIAAVEQKHQLNVTIELLDVPGYIPEIEKLFGEATVKAVMKKSNPQNAAGSSGLRYSHLVEDLAAFATLVFSNRVLPPSILDTAHER